MDTTEHVEESKKIVWKERLKKFQPDWKNWKQKFQKIEWKKLKQGNRTIRTRILMAFGVLLILSLGSGISSYYTLQKVNQDVEKLVNKDIILMQNYEKVSYYMAQRNSSLRGYLLTSKSEYLNQFTDYSAMIKQHQGVIVKHDDSAENQRIFSLMDEWETFTNESVLALMADNQRATAMQNMNEYVNPKAQQIQNEISSQAGAQSVATLMQANALIDNNKKSMLFMGISQVVIIAVSILLALIFSNSISKPMKQIANRLHVLSTGVLNKELVEVKATGEIGELHTAANSLQLRLIDIITKLSSGAEQLAQQSEELSHSAAEVKSGSEQVAITMQELSIGTENQAHSASLLAGNMDVFGEEFNQVFARSEQIDHRTDEVLQLSGKGKELMVSSHQQMEKINSIVQESVGKMDNLEKASQEITKLVVIIQNIAKQTNLLALNAAIEAARAGEHGRGFSVVADEVRKLSEQVANSVKDITQFVENIQIETNDVTKSLNEGFEEAKSGLHGIKETNETFDHINQALHNVVENIHEVNERLQVLTESSKEMSHAVAEIASVSEESAAGVEETSAASEEINSTMEEVATNASQIASLSEEMRTMVGNFQID